MAYIKQRQNAFELQNLFLSLPIISHNTNIMFFWPKYLNRLIVSFTRSMIQREWSWNIWNNLFLLRVTQCGKVIFSDVSVCLSLGDGVPDVCSHKLVQTCSLGHPQLPFKQTCPPKPQFPHLSPTWPVHIGTHSQKFSNLFTMSPIHLSTNWLLAFNWKAFLFFFSFRHSREFDLLSDVNSCFHIYGPICRYIHGCSINTINTVVISYPYCWDRMLLRDELSRKQCFFILPMDAQ